MSSRSAVSGEETKVNLLPSDCESDSESDDGSSDYESDHDRSSQVVTKEEMARYSESVRKSGGFDVIPLRDVDVVGNILPLYSNNKYLSKNKSLLRCTQAAIEEYKVRKEKHVEFVEIVNAMCQVARGVRYYITFDAKDADDHGITKCYQAVVLNGLEGIVVQSFRLKPLEEGQGSSNHGQGWLWKEHCTC